MQRLAPLFSGLWRAVVVLLSLEIALVSALRYLTGSEDAPQPILGNAFANPFLVLHVVGGITALLIGPLQFVRGLRIRRPRVHRASGWLYVAACAIGSPAGFALAFGTTAGPVAGVGFAIPAVLWPIFTGLALRAAIERRFAAHREWMLRSYAITATAITLRLMLPLTGALEIPFFPAYRVIAWLAWTSNLALFEIYIQWSRNRVPLAVPIHNAV